MKSKGLKSQHEESDDEKPRAKDAKSQVQDDPPALVLRDRLEPTGEGPKQPKRRKTKKARAVSSTLNEKVDTKKKRIKKQKQSKNAGAKKIMKSKGSKSQYEKSDDKKPRAEPEGSKDAKSQVQDAPPALVLRDRLEPKGEGPKQPKRRRKIKKAKAVTSSKTDSHAREMLPAMESSTRPEPVDEHNTYAVSDRIGSHEKEDALTRASSDPAKEGSKRWYLAKWRNRWMARISSKKSHQRPSILVSDLSSTSPESWTASHELPRPRFLKRMNQPGHDLKSETSASSRQEKAARQQQPWFVRSEACVREDEEDSVCSSIMYMVFYETSPDGPFKDQPRPINTTT